MLFAHDTTASLLLAADLINTGLPDVGALEDFLDSHQVGPDRAVTRADLDAVHSLQHRLRRLWDARAEPGQLARLVNDLLYDSGARPFLFDHDGWGWHLHFGHQDAPIRDRLAAQAAFAVADLVRLGETGRLRNCEAPGCAAVFTDLSKNQSRRYCDTGNCGNRQHVAAYRQRRRKITTSGTGPESTR